MFRLFQMNAAVICNNPCVNHGRGEILLERCLCYVGLLFLMPYNFLQEDSSHGSDISSYEEAFSPTSPAPPSCRTPQRERDGSTPTSGPSNSELLGINPVFLSSNPSRWSVEEVYEFISSLQGCQDLAEDFRSQEIDGQALLLLKEEHLMSALNIKLGPALKICAKINLLKET
uniref:SAM domain-containing protein n=1 Tax=Engystomops pustulosus TaxID=76066 RepID=A0AAV6Z0M3_ENGPU|nr:hypothetical protein GDO81_028445 [Engystomops pustulosus]